MKPQIRNCDKEKGCGRPVRTPQPNAHGLSPYRLPYHVTNRSWRPGPPAVDRQPRSRGVGHDAGSVPGQVRRRTGAGQAVALPGSGPGVYLVLWLWSALAAEEGISNRWCFASQVSTLFTFFVPTGLGDHDKEVRKFMLDAALTIVNEHGKVNAPMSAWTLRHFANTALSSY